MSHPVEGPELTGRLRTLVGIEVRYQGEACEVFDILPDGPAVVLRCIDSAPVIQPTQYGAPGRRVPQTHTIPVRDGEDWHPEFLGLGLLSLLTQD